MATTGRSRGPASRPPRRPSAAGSGTGSRSGTSGARPSAARSSAPARTSTTGGPTTAKVVRRTSTGWRGRLGGAVTNRLARRALVLASVAVFLVVMLGSTVAAWVHQRTQIAALRDKVAAQEQDVATLSAEQERWTDPAYVEQQARQRLKFVKPGEKSYTVLNPTTPHTTPASVGADVAQPKAALPWYETVWQSARTADAPGARR